MLVIFEGARPDPSPLWSCDSPGGCPWTPVSFPVQGLTVLAGEASIALFIEQGLFICPRRWSPRALFHYLSDLFSFFSSVKVCPSFATSHPVCPSASYLCFSACVRIGHRAGVISGFLILIQPRGLMSERSL